MLKRQGSRQMGIRMLSMQGADWDAFHMSFFMFSTTIFALGEIGSLTPKEKCLAMLDKLSLHAGLPQSR
jgi:hypothetical protein